ncbi:MAG: hypothetical protein MPF33_06595 [Candidatus Aramenus sp.]|jgi:putative transposase|nr:hypothetical protein [Candidatus Aramenus sp.]
MRLTKKNTLFLKDWKMKMPFEGRLRWFGAQGRLEIRVMGNNFYAHISLTLAEPPQRRAISR